MLLTASSGGRECPLPPSSVSGTTVPKAGGHPEGPYQLGSPGLWGTAGRHLLLNQVALDVS